MQMVKKLPPWVFLCFFSIYYFICFCRKTLLVASDLGRHITNGRIIMESGKIFSSNLYSYTQPDYYAPNHHWLFGVLTYWLHQVGGFPILTLLTAFLYTASILVMLWYISKKYGKLAMVVAGIIVFPLLTDRAEVRPEAFSLFFFSANFLLLLLWSEKRISSIVTAIVLGITSVAWVNIHIFFFLGFVPITGFFVQAIVQKNWSQARLLFLFGLVCGVGTLCNPLFIEGALYPFKILHEYGYPIAENQTPFFFLRHYTKPINPYIMVILILSVLAALHIVKNNWQKHVAVIFNLLIFLILTCKLIRFANFLAIIAALIFAQSFTLLLPYVRRFVTKLQKSTAVLSLTSFGCFIGIAIALSTGLFTPNFFALGLGLYPGIQNSAEFFKALPIKGPIFNNFDIGGYLIYHLYPGYSIYVDNRAEAYSANFLQEYKRAQTDEAIWRKIDSEYQFGAIYFNRLERTDWGQEFLVTTIERKEWVPIYVDSYTIIFVRDIPEHAGIIEKYRIPADNFRVLHQ
jgi:hypothetical protein